MNHLDPLLEIEAQANLWDAAVMGLKLWPLIRTAVLENVILRGRTKPSQTNAQQRAESVFHLLPHHLQTLSFLLSPVRSQSHSILFFKPGVDRIYRYFYERAPNPLVFESTQNNKISAAYIKPGQPIFLDDTLKLLSYLHSHLTRLPLAVDKTIVEFADFVVGTYDLPHMRQRLIDMMTTRLRRYAPLRTLLAKRVLPRITSRFVFVNLASYMGIATPLTKALHDEGYKVVEAQHGMVGLLDRAYNYPQPLLKSPQPLIDYLPDYYLTFGEYWSSHVRIPSQKVIIGFPALAESVDQLATVQPDPKRILIVSQWTLAEQLVDVAVQLAKAFPNYQIDYKLHPAENADAPAFKPLYTYTNLNIITNANIHELIARSGIIIGYNSTVLFEVVAFPPRRLFLFDGHDFSATVPADLGYKFRDSAQLIETISNGQDGYMRGDTRTFWADNWRHRMDQFFIQITA